MNSNTRIAATQCSLGTWFCLRNISVDTLHKGDTEDDNDDDDDDNNNNKFMLDLLPLIYFMYQ